MKFIEAPTTFYIGRRYDPQRGELTDDVVYYDSRDLTTHAVVVGMTGSGKTGLCITMLEEAILDDIPAIIIDPKGDITNLLLAFGDMTQAEFQPWVNVDDAHRANMSVEQFAADEARRWKSGLADWGIVPDRVRWLQKAARYSIYTPGSDAGLPISILASLAAPRDGWAGNEEFLREKINAVTTALLALIGVNAEPVKDIEHVLVANIFEYNWQRGQNITMLDLITQVKNPPFNMLGALTVDQAIDDKKRGKLAMALNNIIAAPSFKSWTSGDPLEIQRLLYQPNGRPRVSVFYLAHLPEAERMFIMTLILESMIGWMRTQSGTTSLRALLYIDELYGYFPPYPKNPPTKQPLMTLLKQARAYGLGVILSTQNPGDLDYKGLTNAGTWFIGRLQSEQDRERVRAGLQSLSEGGIDMREVEQLIAAIPPRVFVMRNVHDSDGAVMVHSRWAMSYLRGPLTRQQVQILMQPQRGLVAQPQIPVTPPRPTFAPPPGAMPPPPGFSAQGYGAPPANLSAQGLNYTGQNPPVGTAGYGGMMPSTQAAASSLPGFNTVRPPLPGTTAQYFFPINLSMQQAVSAQEQRTGARVMAVGQAMLAYQPYLIAQASVRFADKRAGVYTARQYAYWVANFERAGLVQWEQHAAEPVDPSQMLQEPQDQRAVFGELSPGLADSKRLSDIRRDFIDMLYGTSRLVVPMNPALKVFADPDEDMAEFEARMRQVAREGRDAEIDKVNQKYGTAMSRLDEKKQRKQLERLREEKELSARRRDEMFTGIESVLSLVRGNTKYTASRMSRASRYAGQTNERLQESEYIIKDVERQQADLAAEFEAALRAVSDKWAAIVSQTQEYPISPLKKDIYLELYGVGWMPMWAVNLSGQAVLLPAFVP